MAMLKQHSPQLPPHQQNPYGIDLSDLQFAQNGGATRTVAFRDQARPRHGFYASAMPQQYARPLSRPATETYDPLSSDAQMGSRQSEHMLRRKTPNGILHAAYDGTSVEQTERPHAMKHILLPISEQFPQIGLSRTIAPQQSFDATFGFPPTGLGAPMPSVPTDMWRTGLPFPTDNSNSWSNMMAHNTPRQQLQLDSVLNQFPIQAPQPLLYPSGQMAYGLMVPQPLQPSFVPTASNSPGPYGPYWPNGTYQPYFPAATRDLRFQPQHTTGWMPNHNVLDPMQNQLAWNMNQMPGPMMSNMMQTPPPNQVPFSNINHIKSDLQHLGGNHNRATFGMNNHFNEQSTLDHSRTNHLNHSSHLPSHTPSPKPRFIPNLSRITATTPNTRPDSQALPNMLSPPTLLDEFGSNSQNARYRDRVFKQAVDIYIDLVKHLHKSRAHAAAHNRNGNSQLTRMYPKPPRPTGQDYTSPPQPVRHNSTGAITHSRPRPFPSRHRHSYVEGRDHSSEFFGLDFPQGSQHARQHSWQRQDQLHAPIIHTSPPPSDRVGHLRREGMDAISPSTTLIPRVDHYPVQNALSALDSLTSFCEDSHWSWVDGLLLGGSLAYALADYQKANDWYSKILEIDSRYDLPSLLFLCY